MWTRLTVLTLAATTAFAAFAVGSPGITGSGAVASATTAGASEGLFLQVSSLTPTYSPSTVGAWMQRVCSGRDLVLQDIGGSSGVLMTAYLDVVAPYLPGGAHACFRRVFVGTADLTWRGAGSKYVQGIQDATFRQQNLATSEALAKAFVTRYPTVQVNWYLTYEADLNHLFYPSVEQAYAALFRPEMQALAAVRPHALFLWSPAFWYPYSAYRTNVVGMTQLAAMLDTLFSTLRSAGGGVGVLALQDFVAGSSCQPPANRVTPGDAVGWTRFLIGLHQIPAVEVNVEQYAINCSTGALGAGSPTEVAARESFYASQGLILGPAFETRYWMPLHGFPPAG